LSVGKKQHRILYGQIQIQFQKPNEVEGKEEYQVTTSNTFTASEKNLDDDVDINTI
jgi:hypothetical protein